MAKVQAYDSSKEGSDLIRLKTEIKRLQTEYDDRLKALIGYVGSETIRARGTTGFVLSDRAMIVDNFALSNLEFRPASFRRFDVKEISK